MLEAESRLANALVERLRSVAVAARVTDRRYVRAEAGRRELKVFCIWYEPAVTGLMLGMNAANARRSLGPVARPHEGAEYYVELSEGARLVADRTPDAEQVVACAHAWLVRGCSLAEVERETPFVRALHRRATALVATLDPELRCSIGGDPSCEVWAYGDGRSCKLESKGSGACTFWFGQAQVAFAEVSDPAAAVSAWLVERVAIAELAARFGDVVLEPHADLIVHDPARWHWLHLLERVGDPDDVLAPLRELVERLAQRPAVTAFYSYSSLFRLCFSASSHFPWVDPGLPIVWRAGDDYIVHTYHDVGVEPARCDLEAALATIERRLTASEVQPLFGSAPHHELEPLARALSKRGSSLCPALVQHGEWFRLRVAMQNRWCGLSGLSVELTEGEQTRSLEVRSIDEAAETMIRFLDRGEAMDTIAPTS